MHLPPVIHDTNFTMYQLFMGCICIPYILLFVPATVSHALTVRTCFKYYGFVICANIRSVNLFSPLFFLRTALAFGDFSFLVNLELVPIPSRVLLELH